MTKGYKVEFINLGEMWAWRLLNRNDKVIIMPNRGFMTEKNARKDFEYVRNAMEKARVEKNVDCVKKDGVLEWSEKHGTR